MSTDSDMKYFKPSKGACTYYLNWKEDLHDNLTVSLVTLKAHYRSSEPWRTFISCQTLPKNSFGCVWFLAILTAVKIKTKGRFSLLPQWWGAKHDHNPKYTIQGVLAEFALHKFSYLKRRSNKTPIKSLRMQIGRWSALQAQDCWFKSSYCKLESHLRLPNTTL